MHKSSLRFLSFKDTLHIHLTISVPYIKTLWTQALQILPLLRYDALRTVKIWESSLNSAQAHLTPALAASTTPPPEPSVSPNLT